MDHLAEQVLEGKPQDYYTRLEQMESNARRTGRGETYVPIEYVPIEEAQENAAAIGWSLSRMVTAKKATEAKWRKQGMRPVPPDTRWMQRAGIDSIEVVGGTLMADGTLVRRNAEEGMQSNLTDDTTRNLALPQHIGMELAEFKQGPNTPSYRLLATALDYEPVSRWSIMESAAELQELNLRLNNPRLDKLVTDMRAFAASPPPEHVMGEAAAANQPSEAGPPFAGVEEEQMLRDVRLEAEEGKVFRLRMYDTYRQDDRGQAIIGYRFEQVEPPAQAMVLFEGEDFAGSPMHAIDSDESLRSLLGFLTLRPGDTDAEYFEEYTPDQMDFAETDAEALQLYTLEPEEGEEAFPLDDWAD
jgi:hypothetical protein